MEAYLIPSTAALTVAEGAEVCSFCVPLKDFWAFVNEKNPLFSFLCLLIHVFFLVSLVAHWVSEG